MEGSNNSPKKSTAVRMALMLVAAVLIGLAYNSVTPLGVVFAGTHSEQTRVGYQIQFATVALDTGSVVGKPAMLLAAGPSRKNLTWPETQALLSANEIVLVDARNAIDYQTEHIPGAISLPATSSKPELADFAAKYPRDTALVIYCESKMCPMAHNLAKELRSKKWGYNNIRIMPGGFAEYRATKAASPR